MKSLKQTYSINASLGKVWDCLVNQSQIDTWGGGPSKMAPDKGFSFSLWGGDIFGKNKEVIPNRKLVQEWYGGKWDKPSLVSFNLSEKGNITVVELVHSNIPDKELKDIESGWKDYYMNPLKELAEAN